MDVNGLLDLQVMEGGELLKRSIDFLENPYLARQNNVNSKFRLSNPAFISRQRNDAGMFFLEMKLITSLAAAIP